MTLNAADLSVDEGDSATYTAVLDTEPTDTVTVTFSSDNEDVTVDTSTANNDLMFTAEDWDTPRTVMVSAAADDDTVNDTATISHAVGGGDYADVAVASLTVRVTVTEVDSTPRLTSAIANRGALVLTYGEPLDSGSTPAAAAFAVTVAGSATTHTVDGVAISGSAVTLTLSPAVDIGETVAVSYTVPESNPIQDVEGNDAQALTDRAAVNETAVEVTAAFDSATYTITEDGTSATVTVALSADPEREVAIPIEAAPQGGATAQGEAGADYSGIPERVTIPSGSTSATFTITAIDDTVDDDAESLSLSFGLLPPGVTGSGTTVATVEIADDDAPTWSVTVHPSMLVEAGGTATLTVSTGGTVTLGSDQTIGLALSGTATAGTDYTVSAAGQTLSSPYELTLATGNTSATATLTGVADSVTDSGETVTIEASLGSTVLGTATTTVVEGICGRTAAVRDAIVVAIGSGVTCGNVTAAQLAGITSLSLDDAGLSSLQADDFAGLSGMTTLDLSENRLTALPANVFDGLTSLSVLSLKKNRLTALPAGVFDGLSALTRLDLEANRLATLRVDAFSGLTALQELILRKNQLSALPSGVFGGLSALRHINLRNNNLSSLPGDVFSGLTSLETLNLLTNRLSSLPDGLLAGLTGLTSFRLLNNGDTELSLTVSLEKVGDDELRAVAPVGAPFEIELPVNLSSGGEMTGGATSITIPVGAVASDAVTVTRLAGTHDAVTADLGTVPALPANHDGYALVKASDLPVEVLAEVPLPTVSIAAVSAEVTEGAGAAFTLTRTGPTAASLDVAVQVAETGTVFETASDYASAVTVNIPTGSATASLTVATDDDAVDENLPGEAGVAGRIAAAVQTGTGYTPAGSGNATASVNEDAGGATGWSIADSAHGVSSGALMIGLNGRAVAAPTASLSVTGGRAEEGTDTRIDFTVTLDRSSARNVTVNYRTVDGTAIAGEDFTAAHGTLTFAPGQTSKTVSVPVFDDPVDEDEERFTLLLYNASGANVSIAQAQGTIANSDPLPRAWLVRFGRTVASHVADGIGERLMRTGTGTETPHFTFAGLRTPFGPDGEAPGSGTAWLAPTDDMSLFGERPWLAGAASYGSTLSGLSGLPGLPGAPGLSGMPEPSSRGLTDRDLLLGSSFLFTVGRDEETGTGGWTWWGRGTATRFDGAEDELSLDGDVRTWMLGADTARGRWLAGVALAHSTGAGGYDTVLNGGRIERGELQSTLTSVHPYARFAVNDRLSAWGLLGYGTGELALDREGAGNWLTETSMRMAAAGARGVLRPAFAGGMELALRTDVLWTSIASGESETEAGRLAASAGTASRLRLVLEGSRQFALAGGRTLAPTVELGVRRDVGDAENGAGVELGGGLRFADPDRGLSVELKARGLVAHQDADYREWGASAAIRFDPGIAGKGLTVALTPSWGASASGTERLWSQPDAQRLGAYGGFAPQGRLDAELGYAMAGPRGQGMQTPYAALSQAGAGDRMLRLGWRLAMSPLRNLDLEGIHRQPANGAPAENAVLLRMALRW